MSLQNERSEPTRKKWLSRFSRERLDLSASVEETLLLDEQEAIQQDLLNSVASDKHAASLQTSQHGKIISPRLTMQSNPRLEAHTSSPSPASQADEEQKALKAQNTGMFARFAQRVTSSLSARGSDGRPARVSPAPSSPQSLDTTSSRLAALSTRQQNPADSAGISQDSQILPATGKPNGRPTKIRLETAPAPVIELWEQWEKEAADKAKQRDIAETTLPAISYEERMHTSTSDMQSLDISASIPITPEPGSPIWDLYRLDTRDSSMRLPAVSATAEPKRSPKHRRETLSGSGAFDAGQRDVTLENTHITSTAIVLVTLTSNPGPAVVQYVSLQSGIGFTVHLSSPATMKTSFNYAILLGELF